MKFKPFGDYVLIEQDQIKKESATGIILAEDRDEAPPPIGTVIESSNEKITKGMRVLFKPHLFDELTIEGITYKVGLSHQIVAEVC